MHPTAAPAEDTPARPPTVEVVVATSRHLLAAGLILVGVIASVLCLLTLRWHDTLWRPGHQPGGWPGVVGFVVLSAIVHEWLHVVGWKIHGGARWRDVSFIVTRRGLGLAALLHQPVPMAAFRAAALWPAVVLGILPLAGAFVTGSGLVALWGAFFLFECITDVTLLLGTRAVPSSARVTSHPTELGCVIAPGPA